ncbi:MAG: oligosaccharide flippase family protein [Kiritimatiellia bacterium]|nr:oligosaccharide flippase family protein [Kiritimatiellia bacterium]
MRKIAKNTGAYTLAGLMPYFAGFFLLPIYTRFIDQAEYGMLPMLSALSSFLAVFLGLQIGSSLPRLYFDYKGRDVKVFFSTLLYSIVGINIILLSALHILGHRFAALVFPRANIPYSPYVLIVLVTLFCVSLSSCCNFMLRVQERGRAVLVVAIVSTLVRAAAGLYFVVYLHAGAYGFLMAGLISAVVNVVLLFLAVSPSVVIGFDAHMALSALRYSLPLIPHSLGAVLFIYSDKIILGYFVPLASVALYGIADQVSMLLRLFVNSFNSANSPQFMRLSEKSPEKTAETYRDIITQWAVAVGVLYLLLALFSEELLCLLPEEYRGAYEFIPILLGAYVFRGLYCFAMNSILFKKKTRVVPWITFIAGSVNIVGNILLIPRFGIVMAAWTTLASFAIYFLMALRYSRKYFPLQFEWFALTRIFGTMLLVFFAVFLLCGNVWWQNILVKMLGCASYVAVLLMWNDGDIRGGVRIGLDAMREWRRHG